MRNNNNNNKGGTNTWDSQNPASAITTRSQGVCKLIRGAITSQTKRTSYRTLPTAHKPIGCRLGLSTTVLPPYDGPSALETFTASAEHNSRQRHWVSHTRGYTVLGVKTKKTPQTHLKQGPRVQLLETPGVRRRQLPSQSADRAKVLEDVIPERHVLPIALVLPAGGSDISRWPPASRSAYDEHAR